MNEFISNINPILAGNNRYPRKKGIILKAQQGIKFNNILDALTYTDEDLANNKRLRNIYNTTNNTFSWENRTNPATDLIAPGNNMYDPESGGAELENQEYYKNWLNILLKNEKVAESWARRYRELQPTTNIHHTPWFNPDGSFNFEKFKTSVVNNKQVYNDKINGIGHDFYRGRVYQMLDDEGNPIDGYYNELQDGYELVGDPTLDKQSNLAYIYKMRKKQIENDSTPNLSNVSKPYTPSSLNQDFSLNTDLTYTPPSLGGASTNPNHELWKSITPGASSESRDELAEYDPGQKSLDVNPSLSKQGLWGNLATDLLGAGRLGYSLWSNNRIAKTLRAALVPKIHNTYELYSPVTGAFSEMQLRNRQAAQTLSQAHKPLTSDASLAAARMLEGQRQANDLQYQGFLADDAEIKRTQNEALKRQEDNIARRSDLANRNRDAIIDTNIARSQLEASRIQKNWASIDEYLKGIESRVRTRIDADRQNRQDFELTVARDEAGQWRQNALNQLKDKYIQWKNADPTRKDKTFSDWVNLNSDSYSRAMSAIDNYSNALVRRSYAQINGLKYKWPTYKNSSGTTLPIDFNVDRYVWEAKEGGVLKLQNGGFTQFFTQYTPVQVQAPNRQQAGSSTSKGSSEREESTKGKLTEKDLFEMVSKVDGLPNDMRVLTSNLYNMFEANELIGQSDVSNLASVYMSNLYQLKVAKFNKEEYDKSLAEVTKNGGLKEYAITPSGRIIVYDEDNNLKQVSVEELFENSDKYTPLTNSNLLHIRAWEPQFANKNEILQTVVNGIGMEKVEELVRSKLSSLGTTEIVRSGYSVKVGPYIQQGMQVLTEAASAAIAGQTGMTLDGMYKNKMVTKEQKQQAEAALRYIYNTLPTNAKTLLGIKAGEICLSEGRNPGRIEDEAKKIIFDLITSRMSATNSSETTWAGNLETLTKSSKDSSSSSGKGSSDEPKTGPYSNIITQKGGEYGKIAINPGTQNQMDVNGTIYSSVPDSKGNPIGKTSLSNLLLSGLQGIVTDPRAITFGDVSLNLEADFNNIMVNGNAGGTVALLPAVKTADGAKRVDLDVLKRWEAAKEQFKDKGIDIEDVDSAEKNKDEITRILYENGLESYVSMSGGGIDYYQFGQFLLMDGYAVARSETNFNTEFTSYMNKVDEATAKTIEEALSTNSNKNNYKLDLDGVPWNNDDVYKGTVYIPITNNKLKGLTAEGQKVKESVGMAKETEYQMFQKRSSVITPDVDLLQQQDFKLGII